MNLKGWQIQGLRKVFSVMGREGGVPYFASTSEAIAHCRIQCYSDINCDYWTYSYWYGCWVEDVTIHAVGYPLTLQLADRSSKFAKSSIAGEFIQHLCDEAKPVTIPQSEIPYCALENYRLAEQTTLAWDIPGTNATVVSNPMECQERCQQVNECGFWTFVYKTGACHMESPTATMTVQHGVTSGPKQCPVTTPGPLTPCNVHPKCVQEMQTGMCCPNVDNIVLGCCDLSADVSAFSTDHTRVGVSGYQYPYMLFSFDLQTLVYPDLNSGQVGILATSKYPEVSAMEFPMVGRRLGENQSLMVMEAIGRRLGAAEIWDEAGVKNQVSMIESGPGTQVSGYAKIEPGSSFSQYEHNLKGTKYAKQIIRETWCAVCSDQCGKAVPEVLSSCPAISGPLQLTNIKAIGFTQEMWDNKFGVKPWYSQWWGILLICLAIVLCAGGVVAGVMYSRRGGKKKRSAAPPMESSVMDSQMTTDTQESQDLLVQELLNEEGPDGREIGGTHDIGDQRLPFPEAGLPNAGVLPFPEAGTKADHTWANQQYHQARQMADARYARQMQPMRR